MSLYVGYSGEKKKKYKSGKVVYVTDSTASIIRTFQSEQDILTFFFFFSR